MLSSQTLQIRLDRPDVVLYGLPHEAHNQVLSGRVVLTTRSQQRVRSLTITLRSLKEKLFQTAYAAAPSIELTHTVDTSQGTYSWPFAISIPGSLNESVFTPHAFIGYEVVAEMRTHSAIQLLPFVSKCVPVHVKRIPLPDSPWMAAAAEGLNVSAGWRNKIELTGITRSRIVHDQDLVRVRGVLRPLVKGLRVLSVGFQLREYVEVPFDDLFGAVSHGCQVVAQSTRAVDACNTVKVVDGIKVNTRFSPTAASRTGGIMLDQEISVSGAVFAPKAFTGVQYDICEGPLRISHDIVFMASIIDENMTVHNIRLSSVVYVMPKGATTGCELPRYEDSAMDTLICTAGDQKDFVDSSDSAVRVARFSTCGNGLTIIDIPPPVYTST
ncbi:hypothetical protein DL89DRAFT_264976 [Linderina pennispora]|uniref:Arrestin-like N-terminal domain-containing protein n=1 Tax=Linderina pennispora TaxID=61395 RepID=A0A1Y1WGZ4_9FUNG|nr:uncharacterized protein DL89DRAFT_264976 [Linderina pennispora]ORX72779.1 hypothetical protein DL89DRAFT_264976 [Linderina pennispora]